MTNEVFVVRNSMKPTEFLTATYRGLADRGVVIPVPLSMRARTLKQLVRTVKSGPPADGVLFSTSGTVGESKLIVRSLENVVAEYVGLILTLGLTRNSNVLITTPITHSYGFGFLMACAELGAGVHVVNATNVWERLSQTRVALRAMRFDLMIGVPFVFQMLLREPELNRYIHPPVLSLAGGETVPVELTERWQYGVGGPLRQEYGLSEVGVVTVSSANAAPESIGSPVVGACIEVQDGEFVVYRNGNPISYYLGDHSEAFTGDGGVRTGDLGYEKDGLYYLTGRKDLVIFVGGLNVVPEEVEAVIRENSLVDEVVVVGHPGRVTTRLMAYVTPVLTKREKQLLTTDVHARLDSHKRPKIESSNELPRTTTGKIDRNAL
ncbi:hypothetical protein LCGC14_1383560 [marine sediment metagenome]|uniref:AMP-dependent synthetase/ligase domain-containing protein n=1 Tax=marine sediment metagenome TaxID=412755 RepID=A0A0F9K260_9ZZZZ